MALKIFNNALTQPLNWVITGLYTNQLVLIVIGWMEHKTLCVNLMIHLSTKRINVSTAWLVQLLNFVALTPNVVNLQSIVKVAHVLQRHALKAQTAAELIIVRIIYAQFALMMLNVILLLMKFAGMELA
jgi:hypothetical protein